MDKDADLWEADRPPARNDDTLVVDLEGFEGPLDLLLHMARNQKVDLQKISVLKLAEQYLRFIEKVREMRLELAADYLVMAAWLAYLKSRLLLPEPTEQEEENAEDLAAILAFRLRRLEAMRKAGASLMNRDRLGREIFARGDPEPIEIVKKSTYADTLYDLLTAYATQRQRQAVSVVKIAPRTVWSLKDARGILTRLIGEIKDWARLDDYLFAYVVDPEDRRTALASSFTASLELVREGLLEIRQSGAFEPVYMKKPDPDTPSTKSENDHVQG
ncbi:MAG: ScpA family protein [Pseudomonadota bacterium]